MLDCFIISRFFLLSFSHDAWDAQYLTDLQQVRGIQVVELCNVLPGDAGYLCLVCSGNVGQCITGFHNIGVAA